MNRRHYSTRTGSNPNLKLSLDALKQLVYAAYCEFAEGGYFDEALLGTSCVDGDTPGAVAPVHRAILLSIRKPLPWPLPENLGELIEDDVFDIVEFLFDHVSKPVKGRYHSFSDCGQHWEEFDRQAGREVWRTRLNPLLRDYRLGFELSSAGEVFTAQPAGLETLLEQPLPVIDDTVKSHINGAVLKFRRRGSSPEDRRDAVRDLVDALEFVRPKLRLVLSSQDESDLFNLANNFGIRHFNERQKVGYEADVWITWMFYHYLATLHVALRLLKRADASEAPKT